MKWEQLARKPRTGDKVRWPHGTSGTVTRVYDDGICWFLPDGAEKESSFIWRFSMGSATGEFNNQVQVSQ
jgi:hypothetical protein